MEKDFSDVMIKGRTARGNILTKLPVSRISLKSHGHSTLGGRKVWFDPDVNRLNYDEHGRFLGEFNDGDLILVVLPGGGRPLERGSARFQNLPEPFFHL